MAEHPCKGKCCGGVSSWILVDRSSQHAPADPIAIVADTQWTSDSWNPYTMRVATSGVIGERLVADGCGSSCGGLLLDVTSYVNPPFDLTNLVLTVYEGLAPGSVLPVDERSLFTGGDRTFRGTWRIAGPWFALGLYNGDTVKNASVDFFAVLRSA